MAKKKKITGQINFYKAMAVLGALIAGFIAYGFLGSAPNIISSEYHQESTAKEQCLQCHMVDPKQNPIMPHRPMDNCTFCHSIEDKPE